MTLDPGSYRRQTKAIGMITPSANIVALSRALVGAEGGSLPFDRMVEGVAGTFGRALAVGPPPGHASPASTSSISTITP